MAEVTSIGIVSVYFDKHQDKIFAASYVSYFNGVLIFPILTEYLIAKMSYKRAMLIEASFNLFHLFVALIYRGSNSCGDCNIVLTANLIKKREQETLIVAQEKKVEDSDDMINLTADGAMSRSSFWLNTLRRHGNILKNKVFCLYMFYFFFVSFGENTFYAIAIEYAVETRNILDLAQAALDITLTGVTSVIGSLTIAILSHWTFDRVVFSSTATLVLGISLIFMPVVQSVGGMYAIAIVFGLAEGLFIAGMRSLVTYKFGKNDQFLTRFSYMLCMIGLGSVLGPIAAVYLGIAVGMVYSFYFLGGAVIAASVVLLLYWAGAKIMDSRKTDDHHCELLP